MSFREHDIVAFCVPGFYALVLLVAGMWLMQWPRQWDYAMITSGIKDLGTIMVFLIPLLSFILGWFINGMSGLLMRMILPFWKYFCSPLGPFLKEYPSPSEAYKQYRIKRTLVKLESFDRFYYRYVLSRNMFGCQLAAMILCVIFLRSGNDIKVQGVPNSTVWWILGLGTILFLLIMRRDLATHIKFIHSYHPTNIHRDAENQILRRAGKFGDYRGEGF